MHNAPTASSLAQLSHETLEDASGTTVAQALHPVRLSRLLFSTLVRFVYSARSGEPRSELRVTVAGFTFQFDAFSLQNDAANDRVSGLLCDGERTRMMET